MRLDRYFQMQRILDYKIEQKFNLSPTDTIFHKLLALIVEIGEASNEHRGFKFWSEDQTPRTNQPKKPTMNFEDIDWHNPLVEEFIDCWHFAISVGISLGIRVDEVKPRTFTDITKGTLKTISWVIGLSEGYDRGYNDSILKHRYQNMLEYLLGLGMAYGFTEDQIEAAYLEKNQINHERQEVGY